MKLMIISLLATAIVVTLASQALAAGFAVMNQRVAQVESVTNG